ncbi:2'-5' RNA ligase family protein [Nonomuraea sp. NPDC051941]|uniref:2'-5' RNA ligase family protein n=1 Tax=Nonomuraea sp. NPDC051941 TaxID=3364373 RepID=UPI0037C5C770
MTVKSSAPALEYKAAASVTGITTGDEGVVEALVSITGIVDNVGDVIVPGAYRRTLALRRPKGIFSHKTDVWVARTEAIEELLPGDPRLPQFTKTGQPWPADAGALWVRARFNLATPHGQSAYEDVKFFSASNECEWSIGYTIPDGGAKKRGGVRYISDLDLWEYSQVLFGAASLSSTLSVKADRPAAPADGVLEEEETGWGEEWADLAADAAAEASGNPTEAPPALTDDEVDDGQDDEDDEPGEPQSMVALMIPVDQAEQLAVPGGLDLAELHITLVYLGAGVPDETLEMARAAVQAVAASGVPLQGRIGGIGAFPEGDDGVPIYIPVDVPGLEVLRQRVADALTAAGVPYATTHGYTPHVTLRYAEPGEALPAPYAPVDVSFGDVVVAVEDELEAFPLGAGGDEQPVAPAEEPAPQAPTSAAAEEKTLPENAALVAGDGWEVKAGKVLSDANARKLRTAASILREVLAAAGIGMDDEPAKPRVNEDEQLPPPPSIMPDSTAPSAMPNDLKEQPAAGEELREEISPSEIKAAQDLLAAAAVVLA